jgi:teichuronic acid biosynthesis glycosyltransferase TuaC
MVGVEQLRPSNLSDCRAILPILRLHNRLPHRREKDRDRTVRVLALTQVFPNGQSPHSVPHIRRQCVALSRQCDLSVLATLPWFPGASWLRQFRARQDDPAKIPFQEHLFGLDVRHPRALYVPKLVFPSGISYAVSLSRTVAAYRGRVDVILSTWAYPDGFAAILLGQLLRIPTVVQVIGSDMDVIGRMPSARVQMRLAFPRAAGVIAVSSHLARECMALGAREETTRVIMTGVDRDAFAPRDKLAARSALGQPATAKLILYVGRLSVEKGAADALTAFEMLGRKIPEARLVLVGDGPLLSSLRTRAATSEGRIVVAGPRPESEVSRWLDACDLLTLPSYHEGTPNVILEALSSGRPVVATRVGGIPDLVSDRKYGELVEPSAVENLANAIFHVLSREYDAEQIRSCPSLFGWAENARQVLDLLREAAWGRNPSTLASQATRRTPRPEEVVG